MKGPFLSLVSSGPGREKQSLALVQIWWSRAEVSWSVLGTGTPRSPPTLPACNHNSHITNLQRELLYLLDWLLLVPQAPTQMSPPPGSLPCYILSELPILHSS